MEEIIGIKNLDTGVGCAGVGFVIIPKELDRKQYIDNCYRTSTVSMHGGKGYGIFTGVKVEKNTIQNISFPKESGITGTPVIWVRDGISQLPVIVGSLTKQNEVYSLAENQYRMKRENLDKTKIIEFFVDAESSKAELNIIGDSENPANFTIKLNSKNKDSVFNLICDNEVNIFSSKKINVESNEEVVLQVTEKGETKFNVSYKLGTGFEYKDEFKNEINCKKDEINISSKKIKHNSGKEPMVLGDSLKQILNDLISAISKLTVTTPAGPSGIPNNLAEFQAISAKLDTILSNKSKIE